jgi:hypothetical protein
LRAKDRPIWFAAPVDRTIDSRRLLFSLFVVTSLVASTACSDVLGLDDLAERAPGASTETGGSEEEAASNTPAPVDDGFASDELGNPSKPDAGCAANIASDLAHCGGCGNACPAGTAVCNKGTCRGELRVRALMDGQSRIVLQGTTIKWHHLSWAAPGRHGTSNEPTYLNGVAWTPTWPKAGDQSSCNCFSSTSNALVPPLPKKTQTLTLTSISARGPVAVFQHPSATNDFTGVIDLQDPDQGPAWFEILITYDTR